MNAVLILFALAQEPGPMDGPYVHEIRSATSRDGLEWKHDGRVIAEHASVPCSIVTPEGKIRIYFVDASNMPETVDCIESTDQGASFHKTDFRIEGLSKHKALDPSIVRLENGKYRLYYFGCAVNPDEAGGHSVFAAISDDGIRFREEKAVFTRDGLVDPDVFWTGKDWLMYVFSLTDGGTVVARSPDGLAFKYVGPLELKRWGTTAPVTLGEGRFRLYAFNQGKQSLIRSFLSTDGEKWTQEEGTRLETPEGKEITDPFVVRLKDGTWKMFYKVSPAKRRPPKKRNP